MKLRAVSVITASIVACVLLGSVYATWTGINWLLSPATPAVVIIEPKVTVTIPTPVSSSILRVLQRELEHHSFSSFFYAPRQTTLWLSELQHLKTGVGSRDGLFQAGDPNTVYKFDVAAVPEPSGTLAGIMGVFAALLRRRRGERQ